LFVFLFILSLITGVYRQYSLNNSCKWIKYSFLSVDCSTCKLVFSVLFLKMWISPKIRPTAISNNLGGKGSPFGNLPATL
jgi:hypothetical protein